jgi:hypothetical protein
MEERAGERRRCSLRVSSLPDLTNNFGMHAA